MNNKAFFDSCRDWLGGINQKQVDGLTAIIDACDGMPIDHVAYIMATAFHETGGTIYPNRESMYYTTASRIKSVFGTSRLQGIAPSKLTKSSAKLANVVYGGTWGEANLGNTQDGDGYKYRGGGMDHTTGRSNYRRAMAVSGVDLINHPEQITNVKIAAKVIAAGMSTGWYRGHKLSDYPTGDYYNMRDIINADRRKNGELVAGYAEKFEAALKAGGWGVFDSALVAEKTSALAAIIAAIMSIIGGKK